MRLLAYMRENGIDDDAMAARIGDCSGSAVKKYKYFERIPRLARLRRIEEVTQGKVGLDDWPDEDSREAAKPTRKPASRPKARAA